MDKIHFDFAIIGQGIAGTLMAHFLLKHGKTVLVIDNNHLGSSSLIAAGIVNPVTGKNFVLSWRINEFLPVAIETYEEISKKLDITAYSKINIVRTFDSVEEENAWLARTADPSVNDYIAPITDITTFGNDIKPAFGYGELTQTMQVNMAQIMLSYKSFLQTCNQYYEHQFNFEDLKTTASGYNYHGYDFSSIIFCEGYKGEFNPFFPNIGFAPAKGEALIIRIPNVKFEKIFKARLFIVPLYDDVYWVGSGYEWDALDDLPSEKGKNKLISELEKALNVSYEVLDHKAAIRPTIYIRRPIVKAHGEFPQMYFFNGLGTKGASIGPYFARQLAKYLVFKDANDLVFE